MAWIDKIRSIFTAKGDIASQDLSLGAFEAWATDIRQIKLKSVAEYLARHQPKLEEQKKSVLDAIMRLKAAKLPNPNIPQRALSLMEGNRETYIRFTSKLAQSLEIPKSYEDLEYFIAQFDSIYEDTISSTQRSYFVLQEFFAIESKDIAVGISTMNKLVSELRDYLRSEGFENLDRLDSEVKAIKQAIKARAEIDSKILDIKGLLDEEDKAKAAAEQEIAKIRSSPEFAKFIEYEQKILPIDEAIKKLDEGMIHNFAIIEAAMKRYERIASDPELVRRYIDDPIAILMQDESLRVLEIFDLIRKSVGEGSIDLKDAKKDKTLEMLDKLGRDLLIGFRSQRKSMTDDIDKIRSESSAYDQTTRINDQLKLQKSAAQKSSDLQRRIRELEAEKIKIALESHKSRAEELASQISRAKVRLVII